MKVVIDTNCLLASIPARSPYYALYRAFESYQFAWVVSNEILSEYAEQLSRRYSVKTADLVISILILAPNTVFQEAYFNWQLIEDDHDDDKFVDVAVAAGADYLVTNDTHFNVLQRIDFPKIQAITLQQFLTLLANG